MRFCYLDPHFPDTALLGVALINVNGNRFLTLSSRLCQSNQEIIALTSDFAAALKKKTTFLESLVVYRVNKRILVPLDKKLWTECPGTPTHEEDTHDFWYKQQQLIKWMETPLLMQMLVAPQTYKAEKGNWSFMPQAPFYISENNGLVHDYMQNSIEPVDGRAKYAAMYVPVKAMSIYWPTKTWKKINFKKLFTKPKEVN